MRKRRKKVQQLIKHDKATFVLQYKYKYTQKLKKNNNKRESYNGSAV